MLKVGRVRVTRQAHERRGEGRLSPLDAELNLAPDLYSHGVRHRVAVQASKTSFEETLGDLAETTGAKIGKRQAEQLAGRASQDFEAFYQQRTVVAAPDSGPVLVISTDGKGVPMRREDLRPETQKEAERRRTSARDLGSEEPVRKATKRMATVAAVYTIERFERTVYDIVRELRGIQEASQRAARPKPESKRVWASVIEPAAQVIASAFAEANRRDPDHRKRWVALVDGNEHQLDCLEAQAQAEGIDLQIVVDLIHVLSYVWAASQALCGGDRKARDSWVSERLIRLLRGRAVHVAAGMRRSATKQGLSKGERKDVDKCADYLLKYQAYLRYDRYLDEGLPIATGVIEGACRHLVKDRMELTGARWRLPCAEAVLQLRALRASGDFEEYWAFHLRQEHQRNHLAKYSGSVPKLSCSNRRRSESRARLTRVK